MKCDGCGEDFNAWTELESVSRKNTTPNCYSMQKPQEPKMLWLCKDCMEKREKLLGGYHGRNN